MLEKEQKPKDLGVVGLDVPGKRRTRFRLHQSTTYGETKCTAVEPIVAFKLASLKQHRRDGSVVSNGWFTLDHAAPVYQFE